MEATKKYYLVFYTAKGDFEGYNIGNMAIETSAVFLNHTGTCDLIMGRNPKFQSVVINNIVELTKYEYDTWLS
jgi:hypothetical protein